MKLQIRERGYTGDLKRWCFELIVEGRDVFRFEFDTDEANPDVLEPAVDELIRRVHAGGPSALSGASHPTKP